MIDTKDILMEHVIMVLLVMLIAEPVDKTVLCEGASIDRAKPRSFFPLQYFFFFHCLVIVVDISRQGHV